MVADEYYVWRLKVQLNGHLDLVDLQIMNCMFVELNFMPMVMTHANMCVFLNFSFPALKSVLSIQN